MVGVALEQEEYFPVRCCSQKIPTKKIMSIMTRDGRRLYKSRACEYSISPAERWYCPRNTCGRWIPPKHIDAQASSQRCRSCQAKICSNCKGLAHESWNCAQDPELKEILKVAQENHWQRCYQCHAIVEKTDGCAHITCRCQAEFWYLALSLSRIASSVYGQR